MFESETDTEVIAKLVRHIYQNCDDPEHLTFRELVEHTCQQLEGAFALVFKSVVYPGQVVATRRGSPLLVILVLVHQFVIKYLYLLGGN